MPELPEVQTVVNTLRPRAVGLTITRARFNRTDIHTPATANPAELLEGRTIADITRRAKRIVFTLDDQTRFYIHLGMTGQLTVEPADHPLKPHTHVVLTLEKVDRAQLKVNRANGPSSLLSTDNCPLSTSSRSLLSTGNCPLSTSSSLELRFRDPRRFGGVFFNTGDEAHIGPEPLTLSPKRLAQRLAKTRRPIKAALLDQRVIAGLGNIYVDESLHASGIHPLKPARQLTPEEIARLNRAIKTVLNRAIRLGGSSISDYVDANGSSGRAQSRHAVYARASKPCRTCKTPIQRIVLGGRSTHFCPRCQPRKSRP